MNKPILMLREDAGGQMRFAILHPQTPHHNLFTSLVKGYTDEYRVSTDCVIVRGQFNDILDTFNIERVLGAAKIRNEYDAILVDPSEVRPNSTGGGSYEKWEYKVTLCVKADNSSREGQHPPAG
jgi:hypothetical protein